MPFDPPGDGDPFFPEDPPEWLARFVQHEVRPFLIQHRQAALEASERWLIQFEEQKRQQDVWRAKQNEFLRGLAAFPHPRPDELEGVPEGFTWREWWLDPDDGIEKRVRAWLPPELSEANEPPLLDLPLPPPLYRDLAPDECCVALVAVHDVCRVREERIGPTDSIPYIAMRGFACDLTEAQLPELQAILQSLVHVWRPADEKMLAGGDTVTAQFDVTVQPPAPPSEFEFVRHGGVFSIRGFGEKGNFRADLIGFQQIALLLKTSGEGVPMVQLVACSGNIDPRVIADGKRSEQPVFDDQAIQEMGRELKELIVERTEAQELGLKEEYCRVTHRIDELTKRMHAAMTKDGKAKDLNNVLNKLRPRIYGTLKTAYQKMREADPPLKEVANHLEAAITSESPCFVYRVPSGLDFKWKL